MISIGVETRTTNRWPTNSRIVDAVGKHGALPEGLVENLHCLLHSARNRQLHLADVLNVQGF